MPLNPFDANFFSFEQKVLPALRSAYCAIGDEADRATASQCRKHLHGAGAAPYAMSFQVTTIITGVSDVDILNRIRSRPGFSPLHR